MDALVDISDDITQPPWGELGRTFTLGVVSGFSKLVLNVLNTTIVTNGQALHEAVYNRQTGQGLITIANHTSTFDDPGILSAVLPWRFYWTEHQHHGVRWSLCAKEICFQTELLRQFFLNGKTLPVQRGAGLSQRVLGVAARSLGDGDWLHVFPEGRIHFDGRLGPLRWGVGKIVCDARAHNGGSDPLVLPFYHSGMGRVLPKGATVPHVGNTLHVTVGEPIDLSDVTCKCNRPEYDQQQVWQEIVVRMHKALLALEAQSPPNVDQLQQRQQHGAAQEGGDSQAQPVPPAPRPA